jgi:deoxyribonuclease-1
VSPDASATEAPDAAVPAPDTDAGSPDAQLPDPERPAGCVGAGGFPQPDADDGYGPLEGLRDQALRNALFERVRDHSWLDYNDARRAIFHPETGVDVHDGEVECVYTGRVIPAENATRNGFNVEHSWPVSDMTVSWPGESDLHHLFASDGDANLRRSSYPYAFTDCEEKGTCMWSLGGSKLGLRAGGSDRVFEVRPERRGDIARAHFYFSVRYETPIDELEEQVLRCWNWTDPPDELERERNARVEAIQLNRNPFVDRPEFVEAIADF